MWVCVHVYSISDLFEQLLLNRRGGKIRGLNFHGGIHRDYTTSRFSQTFTNQMQITAFRSRVRNNTNHLGVAKSRYSIPASHYFTENTGFRGITYAKAFLRQISEFIWQILPLHSILVRDLRINRREAIRNIRVERSSNVCYSGIHRQNAKRSKCLALCTQYLIVGCMMPLLDYAR